MSPRTRRETYSPDPPPPPYPEEPKTEPEEIQGTRTVETQTDSSGCLCDDQFWLKMRSICYSQAMAVTQNTWPRIEAAFTEVKGLLEMEAKRAREQGNQLWLRCEVC